MRALMSKRVLITSIVAVGLVGALGVAGSAVSQSSPTLDPPDAVTVVSLREAAVKIAATYGESSPSDGRAVTTTRRELAQTVASEVPADDPVFAVVLHGKFVSPGPRPYGTEAPTGAVLTLAFDVSTLSVTDLMLTPDEPDLARLGEMVPLGTP